MSEVSPLQPQLTPRKFYFIEYFYILLSCLKSAESVDKAFDNFRLRKEELGLGESKFRTRVQKKSQLTSRQLERYRYTFNQVLDEARDYGLVRDANAHYVLSNDGEELIASFHTSAFRLKLLELMERKHNAFGYLVTQMYRLNQKNGGLIVFPLYSPLELGIQKKEIKCADGIREYGRNLRQRITTDLRSLMDIEADLPDANEIVLPKLKSENRLPPEDKAPFKSEDYTAIISRYRKFWFSYLLKSVYGFTTSESAFEIWAYRGKQLGTMNVTESYPSLEGRIVYPTSLVSAGSQSSDFVNAFSYSDGYSLKLHEPKISTFLDTFLSRLTEAYVSQRRSAKSYFTSLFMVREIVCLKCRISESHFQLFLNEAYERSLKNQLGIRISLEVDRTPEEMNPTYLRREPVLVRSQAYNIIGLDIGSERHGK